MAGGGVRTISMRRSYRVSLKNDGLDLVTGGKCVKRGLGSLSYWGSNYIDFQLDWDNMTFSGIGTE